MIRNSRLFAIVMVGAASAALLAADVFATTISLTDPVTGADSGWQASFPDSADVSLIVDAVTADAVFIEKFVDFDQPPGPGGLIPGLSIDFTQTLPDGQTVPNIVIVDEALTNLTGVDWTGFNMLLAAGNEAWFDVSSSSSFDTAPFDAQTFAGFVDGDPDRASVLRTEGGTLSHLETFFPGAGAGELWIAVDLEERPITSFVLKEVPVPEPGSLLILSAVGALQRKRRRRLGRKPSEGRKRRQATAPESLPLATITTPARIKVTPIF